MKAGRREAGMFVGVVYVGDMKESDQGVGRLHGPVVQVVLPHG